MKKNSWKSHYKDHLLIQCKRHGGPLTSTSQIRDLVNETHDLTNLKSYLRSEVGFQKALHPFDAKERSHLYKINFLSVEELIENLTILLDVSQNDDVGEDIHFPTEEEIYELLNNGAHQDMSTIVEADRNFKAEKPVAADGKRYWCIGFYIQNISDDEIQVDHLKCKQEGNYKGWVRPDAYDVQIVHVVQALPVQIIGEWDLRKRQSVYHVLNLQDIENVYNAL